MLKPFQNTINIFIADDHELIVDALKSRFNSSDLFHFAGRAKDKEELFQRMTSSIDILLLDRICEDRELLETIEVITQKYPSTKIVVLTGRDDLHFAKKVMNSGGQGYISKALSMDEICQALKKVCNGLMTFEIGPGYVDQSIYTEGIDKLTPREKQVLCLLSKGFDYQEVATILSKNAKKDIRSSTIEKHKGNAKDKLRDFGITNDISLGYWIAESKFVPRVEFYVTN